MKEMIERAEQAMMNGNRNELAALIAEILEALPEEDFKEILQEWAGL